MTAITRNPKNIEIRKAYRIYSPTRNGYCKGNLLSYRRGYHGFTTEKSSRLFLSPAELAAHLESVLATPGARYYKEVEIIEYSFVRSNKTPYADFVQDASLGIDQSTVDNILGKNNKPQNVPKNETELTHSVFNIENIDISKEPSTESTHPSLSDLIKKVTEGSGY